MAEMVLPNSNGQIKSALAKLSKEKVENEIIKPKDELIQGLYQDNLRLHQELSAILTAEIHHL